MRSGNRTISQIIMERLIPAATGGYSFFRDSPDMVFWIHSVIYIYLFLIPIITEGTIDNEKYLLIHPCITCGIWLIIKICLYYLHSKLSEDQSDVLDHEIDGVSETNSVSNEVVTDDSSGNSIPERFGIQPDIWRLRYTLLHVRTNEEREQLASQLIEQGYKIDQIMHFYDLVNQGIIDSELDGGNYVIEAQPPSKPRNIIICGCSHVITWNRTDLEIWFDRPMSISNVIFAPLMAFIVEILAIILCKRVSSIEHVFIFLSVSSSQFSLLKSPNPDSNSVTYQGQVEPFTRSFHYALFILFYFLADFLSEIPSLTKPQFFIFETHISLSLIIDVFKIILRVLLASFPILNVVGIIAGIENSVTRVSEMVLEIFFGADGAITHASLFISFVCSACVTALLTFCLNFCNDSFYLSCLVKSLAAGYGFISASFTSMPKISNFVHAENREVYFSPKNHSHRILSVFLQAFIVVGIVYIVLVFSVFNHRIAFFVCCGLVPAFVFIFHIVLPRLMSKYPFNSFSEPFFRVDYFSKTWSTFSHVVRVFERDVLIPAMIGELANQSGNKVFGFPNLIEALLQCIFIINLSTNSYRNPVRIAIALALNMTSTNPFTHPLFSTFCYTLVAWKLTELWEKSSFVFRYTTFHTVATKAHIVCLILMVANFQFLCCIIIMALLLSSPVAPFCGSAIFLPSYPRPSWFWSEPLTYEDKDGDARFYKLISDALADRLATFLEEGRILQVRENTFFFLTDGSYFNAIVHVVSAGNGYISFQLRGLEVDDQTLCHHTELNFVNHDLGTLEIEKSFSLSAIRSRITNIFWRIIDYFTKIMYLPRPLGINERTFVSECTWQTWLNDLPLDVYSAAPSDFANLLSNYDQQNMFFDTLYLTLARTDFPTFFPPHDLIDDTIEEESGVKRMNKNRICNYLEKFGLSDRSNLVIALMTIIQKQLDSNKQSFEWKICNLFLKGSIKSNELWVNDTILRKLLDSFRSALAAFIEITAISIAEGEDGDEFSYDSRYQEEDYHEMVEIVDEKLAKLSFLPEADARFPMLVNEECPVIETLRSVVHEGIQKVWYIRFTKMNVPFRMVMLNSESVLGLWSSQTSETVYIGTENRERGSIQSDIYTLRNIISQSANSPIGYPVVICPTSISYSNLF